MKTRILIHLILIMIVTVSGCSSSGPADSHSLALGDDASYSATRGTNALSWGSPIVLDDQTPFHRIGTSLAIIGGYPAVSYVVWNDQGSSAAFTLYYARANDASGTSWGNSTAVASWEYPHQYNCHTSLVEVNGKPAISYMGWANPGFWHLRYIRAKNPAGTKWGNPVVVDPGLSTQEGEGATMLIVNGNPAIWYKEGFGQGKYVRALDENGDSWGAPIYPDPAGDGFSPGFAVVNGNPAVTYQVGGALWYRRAADASGVDWDTGIARTVMSSGDPYANNRLIIVDGFPAIAFSGFGFTQVSHLGFIRATDLNGSDWSDSAIPVTSGINNDWLGTVAVIDGMPSIAYISGENVAAAGERPAYNYLNLNFIQASDATGSAWEAAETIANTGSFSPNPSLAAVGSGAGIAFTDESHAVNFVGTLPPSDPGSGGTMHVGDLDASTNTANGGRWRAVFTVKIDDSSEIPVSGADVAFTVSGDFNSGGQVTTGGDGTASYQTGWIRGSGTVTFTVDGATHATLAYNAADNHDPDGDSDGTSITIAGP